MHPPDRFTCEEIFARLDDYLDRELSADEMRMVKEHLETCAACRLAVRGARQAAASDVSSSRRRAAGTCRRTVTAS